MPGSGKTTNGRYLAQELGYKFYGMGILRREMARQRGWTIKELNQVGETQEFTDKEVDDFQAKLGQTSDNFVVDGWTSFYFIPHSFKIFLQCDLRTGAARIWKELQKDGITRNEGRELHTVEDVEKDLAIRIESSRRRYLKYYGIDYMKLDQYDLVLDTSHLTPEEVNQRLLEEVNKNVVAAK